MLRTYRAALEEKKMRAWDLWLTALILLGFSVLLLLPEAALQNLGLMRDRVLAYSAAFCLVYGSFSIAFGTEAQRQGSGIMRVLAGILMVIFLAIGNVEIEHRASFGYLLAGIKFFIGSLLFVWVASAHRELTSD